MHISSDASTIMERSRGVFFAQWKELLRLVHTVVKTSDPDEIHDLRVATRRFRAVLELFDPVATKDASTELKKNIRKLTRVLGGLRNIDEALIFFQSRLTDVFSEYKLFQGLSELRSRELKRIERALMAFDHHKSDRMVREMVAGLHDDCADMRENFSLPAYFSDTSIRLFIPIQQLLAVSRVPEHREPRHALRIAIKKWRYVLETVAPVLGCDYTAQLGLLKEYQSILGRMNDIAEFEVLLKKLKLPQSERVQTETLLQKEDAGLLAEFTELIEQKPISYTFLTYEAT